MSVFNNFGPCPHVCHNKDPLSGYCQSTVCTNPIYSSQTIEIPKYNVAIRCMFCDEPILITEDEAQHIKFKICDECKKAILWAKSQMRGVWS